MNPTALFFEGRPMFNLEGKIRRQGFQTIIGIDEAGRGPLAGPVVSSAVFLKNRKFKAKIRDSKQLSVALREIAFHEIFERAYVGVGIINEKIIDEHNILQATYLAMRNAVLNLIVRMPSSLKTGENFEKRICLLIDGHQFKSDLPYTFKTIIRGDESILSIACASIIAKVIRDRLLLTYDRIFPQYGFKQHKGYPTKAHKEAIRKYGPSIIHRRSFKF